MTKLRCDEDDGLEDAQAKPAEQSTLLFINHYREGPTTRRSGPDRTTVGVHVQRIIRNKKQHDIMMRLNSRAHPKEVAGYRGTSADTDNRLTSSHQHSVYPLHHPLQIPLNSVFKNLHLTSKQNSEAQFCLQLRTGNGEQIARHQTLIRSTFALPPDVVTSTWHPFLRSDEIALKFCESSSWLVAFEFCICKAFGIAHERRKLF